MSLNWNFNTDKMGEVIYTNGMKRGIYNGNAFAIFLNEWKEDGHDMYSLALFYADKEHAKRCLSLTKDTKGNDPCFTDTIGVIDDNGEHNVYTMERVVLDPRARGARQLAELLLKAYNNITIELKTE